MQEVSCNKSGINYNIIPEQKQVQTKFKQFIIKKLKSQYWTNY